MKVLAFIMAAAFCLYAGMPISIVDPDTGSHKLKISNNGSAITESNLAAIGKGRYGNNSFVRIVGENPDVDADTSDLWDGDGTYTETDSFATYYMSSSSASDTQQVTIYGLDSLDSLLEVTDTLAGQTKTVICSTGLKFSFVYRVVNIGAYDNVGDVYIYEDCSVASGVPDSSDSIRCKMLAGNNGSLHGIYKIPDGYTGYLHNLYASVDHKTAALCLFEVRVKPEDQVFRVRKKFALNGDGTAAWNHVFPVPMELAEGTIIKINASSSAANTPVVAGYTIELEQ